MTALKITIKTPSVVCALQPPGQFKTWSLADAVAAAAREVDQGILSRVGPSRLPARKLLALLAFCYARQIYGSIEVVARLHYDEGLRSLCDEVIPDAETLRQFRSENRGALEFCLQAALRFHAEEKVAQGLLAKVCEKRLMDEARRRITMAMFTDSMDLEKDDERANQVSLAC